MEIQHTKERKLNLFMLTWPIFIETLLRMLLGNVDTFMLSHYSEKAVAAVGATNQIIAMVLVIYSVVSTGTTIVISQYLGAGQKDKANATAVSAMILNFFFGLFLSLVLIIFARPILTMINLPEELMEYGMQFLRIAGGFSFLQALIATNSAILRSHGSTRAAMFVVLGMNILNALGNCIFLYGLFGVPVMGVAGVAISTSISQAVAVIAMLVLLIKKMGIKISRKTLLAFDKETIGSILKIGAPSAGEVFAYQISSLTITYIITLMGTEALTTRVMTFNIMWFIMISGLSLGQGTQILVGHLIGAGDSKQAYKTCLRSSKIGVVIAVAIAVVLFAFAKPLLGIFTQNPNIIRTGSILLAIAILLEPGRVLNLVIISSLKASGDVKFPVLMGMLSPWGIAVPIAYVLGIHYGMGLIGVWIAFTSDEWLRAIIFSVRWRSRVWENKSLIVRNLEESSASS
ncbi:MAG: MATE family efflux transporter [Clostridia bacterium]|nr:MATE family efflux transporter [Clostridia bacterium]